MPKPNQQQIADLLGLSRTTVSRCFTHNSRINPETRARVFECAAKLGYRYHPQRTIMGEEVRIRKDRVAVLIGSPDPAAKDTAAAKAIIGGLSKQVNAEGLSLEVHYVDPATFQPKPRSRRIVGDASWSDWLGIIMLYPFDQAAISNLKLRRPLISLLEDYEDDDVDYIDTDHGRGISRLMDHLQGLGHRRIGFLSWKYSIPVHWAERRFGAYVESLFRHNLEFDPSIVLNIRRDQHIHSSELPDLVIRSMEKGVTAWVCAADHQAVELIKALQKRGIDIPRDLSITGFDGIPVPEGLPALTSIRMPFDEIGRSAVATLLRRTQQPTAERRQVMISGQLIKGQTTAQPAKD
ncbi:MAG: LacI family DNA-binding transcriptional regulator [Puniceicoccaceae bacterium]